MPQHSNALEKPSSESLETRYAALEAEEERLSSARSELFEKLLPYFPTSEPLEGGLLKDLRVYFGAESPDLDTNIVEIEARRPDFLKIFEELNKDGFIQELRESTTSLDRQRNKLEEDLQQDFLTTLDCTDFDCYFSAFDSPSKLNQSKIGLEHTFTLLGKIAAGEPEYSLRYRIWAIGEINKEFSGYAFSTSEGIPVDSKLRGQEIGTVNADISLRAKNLLKEVMGHNKLSYQFRGGGDASVQIPYNEVLSFVAESYEDSIGYSFATSHPKIAAALVKCLGDYEKWVSRVRNGDPEILFGVESPPITIEGLSTTPDGHFETFSAEHMQVYLYSNLGALIEAGNPSTYIPPSMLRGIKAIRFKPDPRAASIAESPVAFEGMSRLINNATIHSVLSHEIFEHARVGMSQAEMLDWESIVQNTHNSNGERKSVTEYVRRTLANAGEGLSAREDLCESAAMYMRSPTVLFHSSVERFEFMLKFFSSRIAEEDRERYVRAVVGSVRAMPKEFLALVEQHEDTPLQDMVYKSADAFSGAPASESGEQLPVIVQGQCLSQGSLSNGISSVIEVYVPPYLKTSE